MMRGLVGGLARRFEKGGAGLYVWAKVALRERKLAIRGSLGVSSAIMGLGTGVCARNKSGGRDPCSKTDSEIGRRAKEALFIDSVNIAVGNPPALA